MKRKMLLQMQRNLEILVSRKNNLQKELNQIDSLPLTEVTEKNTKRWHEIYSKIKHLENRIETITTEMEILANKNKSIFKIFWRLNNENI